MSQTKVPQRFEVCYEIWVVTNTLHQEVITVVTEIQGLQEVELSIGIFKVQIDFIVGKIQHAAIVQEGELRAIYRLTCYFVMIHIKCLDLCY